MTKRLRMKKSLRHR